MAARPWWRFTRSALARIDDGLWREASSTKTLSPWSALAATKSAWSCSWFGALRPRTKSRSTLASQARHRSIHSSVDHLERPVDHRAGVGAVLRHVHAELFQERALAAPGTRGDHAELAGVQSIGPFLKRREVPGEPRCRSLRRVFVHRLDDGELRFDEVRQRGERGVWISRRRSLHRAPRALVDLLEVSDGAALDDPERLPHGRAGRVRFGHELRVGVDERHRRERVGELPMNCGPPTALSTSRTRSSWASVSTPMGTCWSASASMAPHTEALLASSKHSGVGRRARALWSAPPDSSRSTAPSTARSSSCHRCRVSAG
jgi:hypothetical protein